MVASDAPVSLLAHDIQGEGESIPVVFLHGLTFSRRTWAPIVERLGSRFRSVVIDLPGHGESVDLPRSLDETVGRIHALVMRLAVERPIVVGHSHGAMVATMYAARYPVRGLVNVDQSMVVWPFVQMLHKLEDSLRGPHFSAAFEPIRQSIGVDLLPEPLRHRTMATQAIRQDVVLATWRDILESTPESLQQRVDAALKRIEAPCLAVFGRRLGDTERATLQASIPQIELEEWPDRGHMVHLMELERFTHRLARFVESCGP